MAMEPDAMDRKSLKRTHQVSVLRRGRHAVLLLATGLVAVSGGGCQRQAAPSAPAATPRFSERAVQAGITHQHKKPTLDAKLSNIMAWMASVGATVAAADYNRDGFVDLFFTSSEKGEPNFLYKNNGNGTYTEVAAAAGLAQANDERGTSMDAIWGDVDNDGWPDLYLVRWGFDGLYHNNGDGTFKDVTAQRFKRRNGAPGTDWANGNAAVFLDYNRDGRLDIYVGNYFQEVDLWHLETTRIMHDDFERARNGGRNFFYRQEPDGTFREVAAELGVDDPGWTLALGTADLNNDTWPDLYAANDFGPDQLFLGRPDGTFANVTASAMGLDTKKGMNADFGDFNNDGWLDVYVTNITTAEYLQEGNMLWYNQGTGPDGQITLTDISLEAGTYDGGWGWGAKFFDYDNDGDLDLIAANGFISAGEGSYWYDLASWTVLGESAADAASWPAIGDRSFSGYEKERLWRNDGLFSFAEVAAQEGLLTDRDGRGIAIVDDDNDGDLDVAIANQNQAPMLFRNASNDAGKAAAHWLLVELEIDPQSGANRDGVGTRVTVKTESGLQIRERDGGNGYSGQSDPRLHFGLGPATVVPLLEVRWPHGERQYWENVAVDQILKLRQDPSRYAAAERIPVHAPTKTSAAPATTAALPLTTEPAEIDRQLSDLESRLAQGFDRGLAATYRSRAAGYGQNDRAIDFLTARAVSGEANWRLELSLAYIDKLPVCGGLAAIVCKGTLAKKGLDLADQVVSQRQDSWLAFYSRGMNHLHWPRGLRHSAPAAADFERCLELQKARDLKPYDLRVYVALGQAYAKDGQYAKARQAWQRGLTAFPDAPELKEHLAVADDAQLLALVLEKRSMDRPIDTDLSFYEGAL